MTKAPKKPHKDAGLPMYHTDMQLLEDMERKVAWNLAQYRASVSMHEMDFRRVVYTSIDYCIAVISFRDWIVAKWLDLAIHGRPPEVENGPETATKKELQTYLNGHIDYLLFCQHIANTAKHGRYDDSDALQESVAPVRYWLSPKGQEACKHLHQSQRWDYIRENPEEATFDRALHAKGWPEVVKGTDVLHVPYEQLRSFAALHGIR